MRAAWGSRYFKAVQLQLVPNLFMVQFRTEDDLRWNATLEVDKNSDGKNESCATEIDKVSYEKLNEFAKVQFESRGQITQKDVPDCVMHVDDEVSLSDAIIKEGAMVPALKAPQAP
ncbi:hypothetical protein PR202_gb23222 [Eleusine coracana subsp. coracana]|uniref:Uncharacterized protein n=1 Tax=Eleusine coracana subsp. coracana TaxID=191504 RepID=A0AAV5FIC6_ELECO|nr:hypothetical protein PR202_gb23222 [Eleusine coracana subsp. coracana]